MPPRKRVVTPKNEAEAAVKAAALRILASKGQPDSVSTFAKAVCDLLDSPGNRRAIIERMVQAAESEHRGRPQPTLDIASRTADTTADGLPIFATPDEMPPDLIDVPTANAKYKLSHSTIRMWVSRGKIKSHGRLRARAPGGGYLVVKEADILQCLRTRNPGGRPRKQKGAANLTNLLVSYKYTPPVKPIIGGFFMPLSFHYAEEGATTTLCGKPLDGENYTNQADVPVDCGACYITAVRGPHPRPDDDGRNIFTLTQILRAGDYTAVLNCTVSRNARGLFWYCGSNRDNDLDGDGSDYIRGYGRHAEGGDAPCEHCPINALQEAL